jgi:hypothetical protein
MEKAAGARIFDHRREGEARSLTGQWIDRRCREFAVVRPCSGLSGIELSNRRRESGD